MVVEREKKETPRPHIKFTGMKMSKVKTKWRLNCIKREMGCVQRHFIRAPAEDFVKLTVNRRLCFVWMPWTTD